MTHALFSRLLLIPRVILAHRPLELFSGSVTPSGCVVHDASSLCMSGTLIFSPLSCFSYVIKSVCLSHDSLSTTFKLLRVCMCVSVNA